MNHWVHPISQEEDHWSRTRSLQSIGAAYRFNGQKEWFEVDSSFGIAELCFNQLGDAWTQGKEWRVDGRSESIPNDR